MKVQIPHRFIRVHTVDCVLPDGSFFVLLDRYIYFDGSIRRGWVVLSDFGSGSQSLDSFLKQGCTLRNYRFVTHFYENVEGAWVLDVSQGV